MEISSNTIFDHIESMAINDHPFWMKAKKYAQPIKISLMKYNSKITSLLNSSGDFYNAESNSCFHNSLGLAYLLRTGGAKYIEGLAEVPEGIFFHAWIEYSDRHYDPTIEQRASEFKTHEDWRSRIKYVKLIAVPINDLVQAIDLGSIDGNPAPSFPYIEHYWGIHGYFPYDLCNIET